MQTGAQTPKWRLLAEIFTVLVVFMFFSAVIGLLFYVVWEGASQEALEAIQGPEGQALLQIPTFFSIPFVMFATLVVMELLLRARGKRFFQLGLYKPENFKKTLAQGVGLAVVVYVLGIALQAILSALGYEVELEFFKIIEGNTLIYLYGITAVAWFAAAFGEEVLFRGFIMANLQELFGGGQKAAILAIILQAALFGFLHLTQDVGGAIPVFIMGVVFGYSYYRFEMSLWPLIIAHGLINSFSFTMIYLGKVPMP